MLLHPRYNDYALSEVSLMSFSGESLAVAPGEDVVPIVLPTNGMLAEYE